MQKDGYSLLLPEGLLDYFEIIQVEEKSKEIKVYLEEKNNINPQEGNLIYESKGFYPNILVNDFRLEGNSCYWISVVEDGSIRIRESILIETFIS
jgi:hypothetical protein